MCEPTAHDPKGVPTPEIARRIERRIVNAPEIKALLQSNIMVAQVVGGSTVRDGLRKNRARSAAPARSPSRGIPYTASPACRS